MELLGSRVLKTTGEVKAENSRNNLRGKE